MSLSARSPSKTIKRTETAPPTTTSTTSKNNPKISNCPPLPRLPLPAMIKTPKAILTSTSQKYPNAD
jgi:hypothetical protein